MTNKELRDLLATLPDDLPVWSYDDDIEPIHAPVGVSCISVQAGDKWYPCRIIIRGDANQR